MKEKIGMVYVVKKEAKCAIIQLHPEKWLGRFGAHGWPHRSEKGARRYTKTELQSLNKYQRVKGRQHGASVERDQDGKWCCEK